MTSATLRGVTVRYGDVPVVADLDLDVLPGEWVALIGPNGAGKSSLLRAIAGVLPHDGTITIDGEDPVTWSPKERGRRVAVVGQQPILPSGATVADYVLLGRTPYLTTFGTESPRDLQRVADVLERLDLQGLAGRRLDQVSGGELQRVILARALAQEAPLLLLDEPTSALDVGHQQAVLELIESLRRDDGLTIVSAMHDLTQAGQFADRLMLLDGGRAVAHGDARTVLTEDRIQRHYDAHVRILHDEDGTVVVIPIRPRVHAPASAATAEERTS